MAKKKLNKRKFMGNILFYLKIILLTYPQFFLLFLFAVPLGIIGVYSSIIAPKIIVAAIENQISLNEVINKLVFVSSLMIFSKGAYSYIFMKLMEKGIIPKSYLNSELILNKMFSLSYQSLVDAKTQDCIIKVREIMSEGDRGIIHQFGKNIVILFCSLFGIVFFTIDIFSIDVVLVIVIAITSVINGLYGLYVNLYESKNIDERSNDAKKANYISHVSQNRDYSKTFRLLRINNWISEVYRFHFEKWLSYIKKLENTKFIAKIINALMISLRDVVVYIYLISRLINNQINISDFVFISGLVIALSNWLNDIVDQINKLISFSVSISHIREFLLLEDETNNEKSFIVVSKKPEIEFNSISFKYPQSDKWIFKNFNLKIRSGEKIALVGVNGAGKTTLMHLLMGLLEVNEGKILIDGHDSRKFSKEQYYLLFSPVFQDITVFPETINANIAGTINFDKQKVENAICNSGLKDFVESLPQKGDTYLVKTSRKGAIDLSGGISQKMLIARAFYKDAPINILDEPTAALDPVSECNLYEVYNTMCEEKTAIFISHRLASTKFCDRVLLLENGNVIEEGTHSELMQSDGYYKDMFMLQSSYYAESEEFSDHDN